MISGFAGAASVAYASAPLDGPGMGKVSMMFITDKQYGMVRIFEGPARSATEEKPDQLALF